MAAHRTTDSASAASIRRAQMWLKAIIAFFPLGCRLYVALLSDSPESHLGNPEWEQIMLTAKREKLLNPSSACGKNG